MTPLELLEARTAPGGLPYLLAAPPGRDALALLVLVHGQGRRADLLARAFAPEATEAGFAVVAPRFDRPEHDGYHLLRGYGHPLAAAEALQATCRDAARHVSLQEQRWMLVGFSAGAQFAHRYAMAFPSRVRRLVAASAGWYTLPDPGLAFPYGAAPSLDLPEGMPHLGEFFRIPARVMVGADDVHQDPLLRVSPLLDALQGADRLTRARRWVEAVREAGRAAGVAAPVTLELLPDTGHSVQRAVRRGGFVPRTMSFLLSGEA